jgi:hypothetical protein
VAASQDAVEIVREGSQTEHQEGQVGGFPRGRLDQEKDQHGNGRQPHVGQHIGKTGQMLA